MPRLEQMDAGLDETERATACQTLNTVLADEFLLYTKTRNYHWNIVGPSFHELHKFLDGQYNALNEVVDQVAERIRALGGRSLGSARGFLAHARLSDADDKPKAWTAMLADLQRDHELVVRGLRDDLDGLGRDEASKDLLIGLLEKHEGMAWMLRAFNAQPLAEIEGRSPRNQRPSADKHRSAGPNPKPGSKEPAPAQDGMDPVSRATGPVVRAKGKASPKSKAI